VRLIGPKPRWARRDGGEAGLHPSNIHDNAYAIGAVDFTGDMPVILGPDGPSLGGFVCPATIVQAELWKLGQLKPGDTVRFKRLTREQANAMQRRPGRSHRRPGPARFRRPAGGTGAAGHTGAAPLGHGRR
jgi:urea carboxylase